MPTNIVKNKPIISSITTNYNNSLYLLECIEGLINQTTVIDHVIVIDDCSTDDSWEVLKSFISSVKECNILHNSTNLIKFQTSKQSFEFARKYKNSGPAAGRNLGLEKCLDKTDIVCICDSDDVYEPTKVEKSIDIMSKYPDIALVYTDYNVLNQKTGEIGREFKEPFSYARLTEECIVSNNSIIDAKIFHQIGLYDEELYGPEDYDLWLRISEKALVYHIPEALYTYRITGNNITISTKKEKFASHVRKVHEKKIARRTSNES